jgi:hypothetical protein
LLHVQLLQPSADGASSAGQGHAVEIARSGQRVGLEAELDGMPQADG